MCDALLNYTVTGKSEKKRGRKKGEKESRKSQTLCQDQFHRERRESRSRDTETHIHFVVFPVL